MLKLLFLLVFINVSCTDILFSTSFLKYCSGHLIWGFQAQIPLNCVSLTHNEGAHLSNEPITPSNTLLARIYLYQLPTKLVVAVVKELTIEDRHFFLDKPSTEHDLLLSRVSTLVELLARGDPLLMSNKTIQHAYVNMVQMSDISGLTNPAQDGKAGNRQHTADKRRSKKPTGDTNSSKAKTEHPAYKPLSGDPRKGTDSGSGLDPNACYYSGHAGSSFPIPGHTFANCRVLSEAKTKAAQ